MVFRKFSWQTSQKSSPNREIFMHAFLLADTCFECQVTNCAKKITRCNGKQMIPKKKIWARTEILRAFLLQQRLIVSFRVKTTRKISINRQTYKVHSNTCHNLIALFTYSLTSTLDWGPHFPGFRHFKQAFLTRNSSCDALRIPSRLI